MSEFSRTIIDIATSVLAKRAAQEQGGLLSGKDPTAFNTMDPLRIWIVQVGVIVMTAQLLSLLLAKLRQPKVIAEVLGGILLGPTAFGRIPGFTQHIFPSDSIPYLTLVANIGLVLFLFIVGLEIETEVIKRNARLSLSIAMGGMVLPFGLGAALAVPLYHQFISPTINFTHFMLFTGVAYSITAFPVLCRILTELKLVDTRVGIIVLSAGVGNDIVGWTLLALSIALVNAGSGLEALWILLTALGFTLFLLFPVKRLFLVLARRTGSIENGPTTFFMTITILVVFGSAFFTDIIGVHPIFGGFLAGLIVPREGGLAITLTEKLEDMVSIIFLPLYFTLSGLSTNLGLLNNGITWGFTLAICALAYTGKFGGCTIAARLSGFGWREACTIGTLMSCKGLVELIVLNVGLAAGILSQRVFSMFVFEALVLTFMTTPVVTILYPPERRLRSTALGDFQGVSGADRTEKSDGAITTRKSEYEEGSWKTHFTVVLDKIEHLPGMMTLTQLIQPPPAYSETDTDEDKSGRASLGGRAGSVKYATDNVVIDALRLIELSDRTSAVMKSSVAESLMHTDPLLGVFKTFGDLHNLPVSQSLSVVTYEDLATRVADHAREKTSHLVLVPWIPPYYAPHQSPETASPSNGPSSTNPFDILFKSTSADKSASSVHSHFVRGVFAQCSTDVALFVDQVRPSTDPSGRYKKQHILLPFFGGPDDRLALEFVVQLCSNPRISAVIVRVTKSDLQYHETPLEKLSLVHLSTDRERELEIAAAANIRDNGFTITSTAGMPDTVYGHANTQTRLQSETADNITWARYTSAPPADLPHSERISDALSRIEFTEVSSPTPLHQVLQETNTQSEYAALHHKRLLLVVGRSRRLAVENHHKELKDIMEAHGAVGGEMKKTVGDVAAALVVANCGASVVVVQAAHCSKE